ncbi:MAG: hypothetical protein LBE24_07070, partial [Methylobacillus sp.]|nr:hypothetical protein [Methylobacillus sp.]
MDIEVISEWLKTSITGIVLLGAIGSIIAIGFLKYLGPSIRKVALKPLQYMTKEKMWRYWRSGAAYAYIENDPTNRKVIFYLFRHVARLIMAVATFVLTTIVFSIVVASRSEILLTYGTFILSTLAFLSAYWVKIEYDYITINYIAEWQG